MKYILLKKYIDKLSIDDIDLFLKNNNIILNHEELIFLLNYIKKNYEKILKNDDSLLFNIENKISYNNYLKIYNLYFIYKEKYNYLLK